MDQQRKKYKEPKDTLWGKCLTTFIAIVFAMSTLTIIPLAGALDNPANEQADAAAAAAAKEAAAEAEGKMGTTLTEETPKPIENLINEDKKGETLDTVENVLGVQSSDENDAMETVPSEVQAFLDAVKKLPAVDAVTAENAEGVGEQVNAVLDMWDAMSVENGEREDVSNALEQAYAVFEAVLAVEGVGGVDTYTWDQKNEQLGTITKHVGEAGYYQRLPRKIRICQHYGEYNWYYGYHNGISLTIPDETGYLLNQSTYQLGTPNVLSGTTYKVGNYKDSAADDYGVTYYGDPCLEFDYVGVRPGTTSVILTYYYKHNVDATYRWCDGCNTNLYMPADYDTYNSYASFNVQVVADYVLNFETNGGNKINSMHATEASDTAYFVLPTPVRDGYTFDGWYKDQSLTEKAGDAGHNYGVWWVTGKGSVNDPVTATLYAKWTKNDSKPDAPEREDLYGVLGNFVQVECVSEGDGLPHAAKKYSTNTYYSKNGKYESSVGEVYKADDGAYKVDVTLNSDVYAGLYGFEPNYGTGVEHTLKAGEASTQTITLTWDVNTEKWVGPQAKGTVLANFKVVCKSADPTTYTVYHEYYTNGQRTGATKGDTVNGAVGQVVQVSDLTKNYTYEGNTYGYTRANKGNAVAGGPIAYTLGDEITELTLSEKGNIIVLRYDRTTESAPNAPTEQEVNREVRNANGKSAVVVYCQPGRHQPGYFDCYNESENNSGVNTHPGRITIGEVQGNAADGYTCDVTFLADEYLAAYNTLKKTDGEKAHVLVSGEENKTVTFNWDATEKKWVLAENQTSPVTFNVRCPNPKLTSLSKERLTTAPEGMTLNLPEGTEINYAQNVIFVGNDAPAATLLYKLTVTGTEGAAYKVTDENATWVGGDPLEGTIADGKTEAVIYVTKTFTKGDVANGRLVNNAKLESNNPVTSENPNGTEGPDNGDATGEAGAKKQYNVIINFTTDGGAVLQDPSKTTVDEGADFNYSMGQTAARMVRAASATGSDVNAVVIPQRLGANNEYVLDEVASAEGLDKLAHAQNITADIVADIVYSLDTKGTINPDGTDTFDGTPDKYQVKVTYKVANGAWNDESIDNVVTYLKKYKDGIMAADGIATLGDTIPAVGDKPATGYEAGSWNETPASDTTISSDAEYTYTYKLITYTITYDLDGGIVNGTNPATYTVDSDGITLTNPTREGYTFAGWTGTGLTGATDSVTIAKGSTGNRSYTATWNANGDTAYTVEHYQQNLDGTYSLVETENLTGATDSMVTATVKAYEGFTHNPAVEGTLLSATVAGNGSTVLSVYYDRNTYTVSYDLNGGTVGEDVQTQFEGIRHGDTTPTIDDPARTGYIFAGWTPEVTDTVTGDVTYVAQWTPVTFDIDVQVVNGTSDAATAGTTVNYGGDVTYTFIPNDGYVLDSVMVDGNPAALSADGTFTFNAVTRGHTIVVTYVPAPVIPPTPTDPTPTPTPTPGPTPAVTTPADAAAPAAAAAAVEAIGDAENPLAAITTPEAIDDDANALAAFEEIHCWTHWLMLFGALVTIVYGLGVLYRRRHDVRDMDDFEGDIMDGSRRYSARQASDPAANGAFQAM